MFNPTFLLLLALATSASPVKRANNQLIVSSRDQRCLSPAGGAAAVAAGQVGNGTPLVTIDCNSAAGWDISPGSGSVVLTGTNFAMDAGSSPGNNGLLKTWQSYPGLFQQTWYLTADGRIAITGGNQCLDEGTNGPQTYQCTTGNGNQAWSIRNKSGPTPPTSSSSASPSPSTTPPPSNGVLPNVPRGNVYTDPAGGGKRIHPFNRDDLCLTVQGGSAFVGALVEVTYCFPNSSPYAQYQLWDTTNTGPIKLHSNNGLCLDAGSNPSNNGVVKVWSCGGYGQQQFTQFGNQGTVSTINNQCLDVQLGSGPSYQPNYPNQGVLQTYQCYPGSPQQNFHLLY